MSDLDLSHLLFLKPILKIVAVVILGIPFLFIFEWLKSCYPMKEKKELFSWYKERYRRFDNVALSAFLVGIGVGLMFYWPGFLDKSDPRGYALGLFLGLTLSHAISFSMLYFSKKYSFEEYAEYQEYQMRTSAKVACILYVIFVLPFFLASAYGTIHLLVLGF